MKLLKNDVTTILFILSLNTKLGFLLAKKTAADILNEPCTRNSRLLNDCNWCTCSKEHRFVCSARDCSQVDMFGHFNDAIKEMNVGMEGRGSWRSSATPCEPGVHYQRDDLLCVCKENGDWPNPVCRDIFRVLHPVELVKNVHAFKEERCLPTKLYLVGCNVCYCPEDGRPNPEFCTKKSCAKNDPIFEKTKETDSVNTIYYECDNNKRYKFGCKDCICVDNNNLVCSSCKNDSSCHNKEPNTPFNVDCNICYCNGKGQVYCTVRKCFSYPAKDTITDVNLRLVQPPISDIDCTPGTKYRRGCNMCYCLKRYGIKKFACTVNNCTETDILKDCVVGKTYAQDCMRCQCGLFHGVKVNICEKDSGCQRSGRAKLLSDMRGYCEPMHVYKKDCNTCRCLPNGKVLKCSTFICPRKDWRDKPIVVDLVSAVKDVGDCEDGHTFMIDCNICRCFGDGSILCTTRGCPHGITDD